MIIHINQTLQSYLVNEKKMIYFLEHAGVRGWFSRQRGRVGLASPRCVFAWWRLSDTRARCQAKIGCWKGTCRLLLTLQNN